MTVIINDIMQQICHNNSDNKKKLNNKNKVKK